MEEVAERTYQIEVLIPGVDSSFTIYFLREAKGVLIEPGPAANVPSIRQAMQRLEMKELDYIIPTHIHLDHAGAIGSLAQLFPNAKVIVHPSAVEHVVNPSRLIKSTRMAFGDDFDTRYGPILPVPESQIKVPEDGETVSIGGKELQLLYTPGHANHHIAIFDLKTGGLFCGEALGLLTPGAESLPLPAAAPPGFDMELYLDTMERLRELAPRILFYSHYGIGRDPQGLISRAAENTRIFGDIILKALREGEAVEAIYHRVYEYYSHYLGINVAGEDTQMTIDGFIFYFKRKGVGRQTETR